LDQESNVIADYPVLVIDDEEPITVSYKVALANAGIHKIITCNNSSEAMNVFNCNLPGVVLLDLIMPQVRGEDILQQISENHGDVPVIVITGNDDIELAVRCMKIGAYDYLVKPVSRERLVSTVKRALLFRSLQLENEGLKAKLAEPKLQHPEIFRAIITQSAGMRALFSYIEAAASTPHPFLIAGETGVGKELFARAVHDASGRSGPFVALNVAGLDDNVFADTLFGHKRGAFTGADSDRAGMIDASAGGSIFLDEIGDLSQASQIKLLRLLQESEYLRLGEDRPVRSTARVIVATNADLRCLQESGKFRSDLYYRLNTHAITVPPLRERREDIGILLDHFVEQSALSMQKKKPTVPAELVSVLAGYSFPGNVRELKSMADDAVGRHESRVMSMDSFKAHIKKNTAGQGQQACNVPQPVQEVGRNDLASVRFGDRMPPLKEAKRYFVEEALRRTSGNLTKAAELLGTTRQALSWYNKDRE
jgi:DNA-binding NtrC family response regulator